MASLTVSLTYPLLRFRESNGPLVQYSEGAVRFLPYMDHIDLYWQRLSDCAPTLERYDDLGFDHAYRKEIGDFVRWVTDGTAPCLTWREGLRCVEVIEAAHLRRSGAELYYGSLSIRSWSQTRRATLSRRKYKDEWHYPLPRT
ncbi:MAG: hypothetical protein U0Q18_02430 [Bryobacteraceae bacterium]